jgi:DNA-binding transcriptional LysR family regulator
MSQPALSHAVRALEERLGVRLLARTTRSVSASDAGERLLQRLRPALDEISAGLTALGELRDRPAGTVRITAGKHAAISVLWPVLERFGPAHPDIQVEVTVDDGLTDIVAGRYDGGIRLGEQVERDMIAVRVGPDMRMAAIASPSYFDRYPLPRTPHDLAHHDCINYRQATAGGLYAWEFERDGQPLNVRVSGSLVFNDIDLILAAALAGRGMAHLFEDHVVGHIAKGRLVRVLHEWCPSFPGYFLYYPSRRQTPPAMAALVEALRYKP